MQAKMTQICSTKYTFRPASLMVWPHWGHRARCGRLYTRGCTAPAICFPAIIIIITINIFITIIITIIIIVIIFIIIMITEEAQFRWSSPLYTRLARRSSGKVRVGLWVILKSTSSQYLCNIYYTLQPQLGAISAHLSPPLDNDGTVPLQDGKVSCSIIIWKAENNMMVWFSTQYIKYKISFSIENGDLLIWFFLVLCKALWNSPPWIDLHALYVINYDEETWIDDQKYQRQKQIQR